MPRTEGHYWVRERAEGTPVIAAFRDGQWTFGDTVEIADESRLDVVGERLVPPPGGKPADWQARYDQIVQARKKAGERDPLHGWDYLPGFYWVSIAGRPEPVLAQYLEGWGDAAGEEELDEAEIEIIDGPLLPPQVAKRHIA